MRSDASATWNPRNHFRVGFVSSNGTERDAAATELLRTTLKDHADGVAVVGQRDSDEAGSADPVVTASSTLESTSELGSSRATQMARQAGPSRNAGKRRLGAGTLAKGQACPPAKL